jgi:peptidoglycan/LPS O-acetylase OafA/YrhL
MRCEDSPAPVRAKTVSSQFSHPEYRPDIDGLRAIAVLFVVGYHYFPDQFPGGFIGVDVFFVISGYLITSIILANVRNGGFSYFDFYARRIRRIFPALAIVLSSSWIFGWFFLQNDEYKRLGKHIAAGAVFVSNFSLWSEAGYFDKAAESKPLLHLWSLGIEEQFYIVWPFLLIFIFAMRLNILIVLLVSLATSLIYCLLIMKNHTVAAFYSPASRFWELAIGGVLSYLTTSHRALMATASAWQSAIGLTLIAISCAAYSSNVSFPGWRAILPTMGAMLAISGRNGFLNARILSYRPLVALGLISYPFYLWHWPILSFSKIFLEERASFVLNLLLIGASVLLAWATYRFVERPIRERPGFTNAKILAFVVFGIGAVGYNTYLQDGYAGRYGDVGPYLANFANDPPDMKYMVRNRIFELNRDYCDFYDLESYRNGNPTSVPRPTIPEYCFTKRDKSKNSIFIWGDSHAWHLYYGLQKVLAGNINILQVTSSGCPVSIVTSESVSDYCSISNKFALQVIAAEKPELVLLAQAQSHDEDKFREIASALKASGVKKVFVVGPVPHWKPDLYKVIAKKYFHDTPERISTNLDQQFFEINDKLKAASSQGDLFAFVDVIGALCNSSGCLARLGADNKDGITTWDYGHLTPVASAFVAEKLLVPMILKELGK